MRNLYKWLGVLTMLVVMCISTGQTLFAVDPSDSCCQELSNESGCSGEQEEDDCANKGNPFQLCSCCPHAVMPAQVVVFESKSYQGRVVYLLPETVPLIESCYTDFWQPPRFS
jgi:hypothetical protein